MMDDTTQKLVDEARKRAWMTMGLRDQASLIRRLADALEAVQPVTPDRAETIKMLAGHIEAAQHPHHRSEVGPDALDEHYLATVVFDALLPLLGQPRTDETEPGDE